MAEEKLRGDVAAVYSTEGAFCVVRKSDGGIVTWGNPEGGGDCSKVEEKLRGDVAAVYSTSRAFCAVRKKKVISITAH